MKQVCLVFREVSVCPDAEYSTTLKVKDDSMLEQIKEALKPFGYIFRFPKRG